MLKGPINEKNTTTSIPNYIPTTVYMYNGYQVLSGLSPVSLHPLGTPWWRVQAQVIIWTKWVFFCRMNKKWWVLSTRSTPHFGGSHPARRVQGPGWNAYRMKFGTRPSVKNTNVFFLWRAIWCRWIVWPLTCLLPQMPWWRVQMRKLFKMGFNKKQTRELRLLLLVQEGPGAWWSEDAD